uniref:Peptidase S9 prolyl oligopeptidase catalytic domain-containing protein n=1 Tax=Glossina brevipalpis TaxID=37001 RepID=A0A1A9X2Q7_9MUSC
MDTGASHSILNRAIVKGKFEPLFGAKFRIATGEEAAIRGMDFMAKHGFVLDLERQVLQYANMALPLTTGYGRGPEELQVVIERLQEIPPNSEAILWATSNEDLGTSRTWVVEPAKNCTTDTIIVGKAVVTPINNLIPVRVINPTRERKKIYKGTTIVLCQKVEFIIDHKEDMQSLPHHKTRNHLCPNRWSKHWKQGQKIVTFGKHNCLGEYEVADQIHVTKYLQQERPYIGAENTGIWGWNYGGYLTARTLANDAQGVYKQYLYRYMGLPTPEDNLQKYLKTDAFENVENFRYHDFLFIHGSADNNVHYQNSLMLAKVLQQKQVMFDEMTYTDENHSIGSFLPCLYQTMGRF